MGKAGAGSWVFRDSQKRRGRDSGSRERTVDCLGGYTHTMCKALCLVLLYLYLWPNCPCVSAPVCRLESPLRKFHLGSFPVFLLAHLCVSSFILSSHTTRNFNDPVSPGVQSVAESADILSPRLYAHPRVWTGPLVGSMFVLGPEEHLWRLALPDQSHKGPRGICNSTLLQTFSVSPVGAGLCFPCICVCFLVFALICFHLSLSQSLLYILLGPEKCS